MGGILSSCGERLSKFTCKSSCSISDGEKEIIRFRKTLSFEELVKIKAIIENEREIEKKLQKAEKIYQETIL